MPGPSLLKTRLVGPADGLAESRHNCATIFP